MRDARDNSRKAYENLEQHYAGNSKPRIISLYTQLTSLKKNLEESITDYILRAESAANALRNAGETVSDGLLVAMVVKGLPDDFQPFIVVTNQAEDIVQDFQKFKQALRNFQDTENARKLDKKPNVKSSSVMKTHDYRNNKQSKTSIITCHNCGIIGHKSSECNKPKTKKWCNYCRSSTHTDMNCRKQKSNKHNAKFAAEPEEDNHTFSFKVSENELYLDTTSLGENTDTNFLEIDSCFKPEEHYIKLDDGSKANNIAKKRGTILISLLSSEGKSYKIKLENVLYVPSFPQCIFPVQAATPKGAKVNFDGDHAVLLSSDGIAILSQSNTTVVYITSIKLI